MSEEIRANIGTRLKEERDRFGLSQASLAEVVGVSRRAVVTWESGGTVPGADALALLAAKGVDVMYVITGQRSPIGESTLVAEEKALLNNYRSASPQRRASIREVSAAFAQLESYKPASGE